MKRTLIIALVLVVAIVTVATASDIMTFENKKGTITFKHKEHQERLGGDCTKCHEGTPAKFGIDKTFGHGTCKTCHKEMNGPTKCNGCHQKN